MEVITTHMNADFDAMGSMIAAKKLYPEALLVFPGSQERTLREYFIRSTVYIYGFKRLRDIDIEQVTRLILVDTRQSSRIGKFADILNKPGMEVHVYDHHPDAEDDVRADQSIVKNVGSTVTLFAGLFVERGIEVSPEEATIMSLGVFEDTGSFTFSNTTPEDFEAAAFLLRSGANLNVVSDMVTRELSAEQVSLLNELILSAKKYSFNGVEVCLTTVSVDRYVGDFAVLVHKLRDIENLDVVFALARMDDRVYLVARSRIPEVNVATVASIFGGGGHSTAASASIKDLTLVQTEEKLVEALRKHIHPYPAAENLMTSPPIGTEPGVEIGEAHLTMVRYNINALPVLENGALVGLISRQVLEKALFHGLTRQTVAEFMNTDFASVGPDASLLEIQTYLVERHQRILPVVGEGKLLGVITRRDLLDFMISDHTEEQAPTDEEALAHWSKRKNIQSVLAEQLPRSMIGMLKEFGRLAETMDYRAYAVGGFVRDLLLRRTNFDLDIVVEGDAIEFARAFSEQYQVKVKLHRKFSTAMLVFPDGHTVDVASARFEYYQHPAALPIVEFSSLKMDLYRRDFTINTLAVALNPDEFGQLIDFFSGQRDIKEKIVRVLHNLSFIEDPTRILRAIRFEQRFGFKIGKQSASLIRNAVRLGLIQKLGGRRLFHEVTLILEEDDPLPALRRMAEFAVMPALSAEINFDRKMEELFARLREVISWYRLSFLDEPLERWHVYLLGLFSNLGPEEAAKACDRLLLSENQRDRLLWTLENTGRLLQSFFPGLSGRKASEVYRALLPFRPEELLFLMGRADKESTRKAVSHYFHRYRNTRTEIQGRDLKAMGIVPGPIYRMVLDELLDARLNKQIGNRREEIDFLVSRWPELFPKATRPDWKNLC
ncbi:MAG: CBS domain-containing protein [Syntrophobacteraceae bacterium]|nr:CBS domain-containing protein [Syntrophobacteraceae bacterium]